MGTRVWTTLLFVLLQLVSGCGGGSGRLPVSGEVTLGGQPLDQGLIQFVPADKNNTFRAGAEIRDGKYEIPAKAGLVPGTYRVMINSGEASPNPNKGAKGEELIPITKERIPAAYNSQSKEQVEVKQGAENRFDFAIELPGKK